MTTCLKPKFLNNWKKKLKKNTNIYLEIAARPLSVIKASYTSSWSTVSYVMTLKTFNDVIFFFHYNII